MDTTTLKTWTTTTPKGRTATMAWMIRSDKTQIFSAECDGWIAVEQSVMLALSNLDRWMDR